MTLVLVWTPALVLAQQCQDVKDPEVDESCKIWVMITSMATRHGGYDSDMWCYAWDLHKGPLSSLILFHKPAQKQLVGDRETFTL